jgi:hypothetical protein
MRLRVCFYYLLGLMGIGSTSGTLVPSVPVKQRVILAPFCICWFGSGCNCHLCARFLLILVYT